MYSNEAELDFDGTKPSPQMTANLRNQPRRVPVTKTSQVKPGDVMVGSSNARYTVARKTRCEGKGNIIEFTDGRFIQASALRRSAWYLLVPTQGKS